MMQSAFGSAQKLNLQMQLSLGGAKHLGYVWEREGIPCIRENLTKITSGQSTFPFPLPASKGGLFFVFFFFFNFSLKEEKVNIFHGRGVLPSVPS